MERTLAQQAVRVRMEASANLMMSLYSEQVRTGNIQMDPAHMQRLVDLGTPQLTGIPVCV